MSSCTIISVRLLDVSWNCEFFILFKSWPSKLDVFVDDPRIEFRARISFSWTYDKFLFSLERCMFCRVVPWGKVTFKLAVQWAIILLWLLLCIRCDSAAVNTVTQNKNFAYFNIYIIQSNLTSKASLSWCSKQQSMVTEWNLNAVSYTFRIFLKIFLLPELCFVQYQRAFYNLTVINQQGWKFYWFNLPYSDFVVIMSTVILFHYVS